MEPPRLHVGLPVLAYLANTIRIGLLRQNSTAYLEARWSF
jgi:hypothetical protein